MNFINYNILERAAGMQKHNRGECKMDTGIIFLVAIFLIIAIWIFITMTDFTANFIGGGILAGIEQSSPRD